MPSLKDQGFTIRRYLDILHAKVPATLTDATAHITGAVLDAAAFSNMKSGGEDVRFSADIDGNTEIPTDLTEIDTGSSEIELHKEIPTIQGSTNTRLYMWYGNAGASRPADSAANGRNAVWGNSVSARLSMKETSGNFVDSTGNGLSAARTVLVATDKDGGIGDGQKLNDTDYLTIGDDTLLRPGSGDFTISLLMKCNGPFSSSSHRYPLIAKGSPDQFNQTAYSLEMLYNSNGLRFKVQSGFSSSTISASSNQRALLTDGNWHMIDVVIDQGASKEGEMFIDGVSVGFNNSIINCAPTLDLLIGKVHVNTKTDAVWMDEIRFYQRALSTHEIGWKYNNWYEPENCFDLGPEEVLSGFTPKIIIW